MNNTTVFWNLKVIINDLIDKYSEIEAIYLFGSRAYNTNSMRSDIDLLAVVSEPIAQNTVND